MVRKKQLHPPKSENGDWRHSADNIVILAADKNPLFTTKKNQNGK